MNLETTIEAKSNVKVEGNCKTNPTQREQNYELLRIVSMLMIVVWHILMHGKVLNNTEGAINTVARIAQLIIVINVNLFVLITGYYQSNSTFKLSKMISLNNQGWFYRIAILILVLTLGISKTSKTTIMKEVFPISSNEYWFLRVYIVLYAISPFLNTLKNNINQKQYKSLLIILFILFSILPSISGQAIFNNERGHSITHFCFIYLLGAYLRKYPISIKIKKYKFVLVVIFIACILTNYLLFAISQNTYQSKNEIIKELSKYINKMILQDDNPIVVIQSTVFFLYFGTLKLKNKIIGKISKLTFGIYLIHDNSFMRENIYKWLLIDKGEKIYEWAVFWDILKATIIIFIICSLIEYIRRIIFKFIYNLKICQKFREKYINKVYLKIDNSINGSESKI